MSPATWTVTADAIGNVRSWDDAQDGVFYSKSSGDTHLVDALALELYELLLEGPMSETSILHFFGAQGELAPLDALNYLRQHLTRLRDIDLLQELSD